MVCWKLFDSNRSEWLTINQVDRGKAQRINTAVVTWTRPQNNFLSRVQWYVSQVSNHSLILALFTQHIRWYHNTESTDTVAHRAHVPSQLSVKISTWQGEAIARPNRNAKFDGRRNVHCSKATVKPTLPVGTVPNSFRKASRGYTHEWAAQAAPANWGGDARCGPPAAVDFKLLPYRVETAANFTRSLNRSKFLI